MDKTKHKRKRNESLDAYVYRHSPAKAGTANESKTEQYTKILPRLYLGNYKGSESTAFFKEKSIKGVVNCTKDLPCKFVGKGVEYIRLPVDDSLKAKDITKMGEYLPFAVEFIARHRDVDKHPVFVHCVEGKQRSACVVAAYLISKRGMTAKEACKFVMDKRTEAFHHGHGVNFENALVKWEKTRR
jgi:dual specificity MAP kinase phosphatase